MQDDEPERQSGCDSAAKSVTKVESLNTSPAAIGCSRGPKMSTTEVIETDKDVCKRARKAGIASFVGTTIEWYDFYIYGLSASLVFGDIFFSKEIDPNIATLLSFLTLWIGFLARPVGGILFGHLGDRFGRKSALVITLMTMVSVVFSGVVVKFGPVIAEKLGMSMNF